MVETRTKSESEQKSFRHRVSSTMWTFQGWPCSWQISNDHRMVFRYSRQHGCTSVQPLVRFLFCCRLIALPYSIWYWFTRWHQVQSHAARGAHECELYKFWLWAALRFIFGEDVDSDIKYTSADDEPKVCWSLTRHTNVTCNATIDMKFAKSRGIIFWRTTFLRWRWSTRKTNSWFY